MKNFNKFVKANKEKLYSLAKSSFRRKIGKLSDDYLKSVGYVD